MVVVTFLDLPPRIKAMTVENEDSSYTIILNSQLTHEQNLASYKHELNHIRNNDFCKECVDCIECNAHKEV